MKRIWNEYFVRILTIKLSLLFLITVSMQCIVYSQNKSGRVEQKIDSILVEFNSPQVPGAAVMIIKNHKVIYSKGYGLANLSAKKRIDKFTNFRLASISKQFTAMCIMILKGKGKIKYENSLKDIFPDFPEYGKKITIKNLLQHTSGLVDYEDLMPDTTTAQVHDKDVLKMMMSADSTYFTPGSKYKYSNSGYAMLAMIVEKISGKRYADFIKENIFIPLGMKESVAYEKGISEISNRALGYVKTDTGFTERDQSNTSAVLGDGGIYTSLTDYKKWDDALYSNKLINRKTLKEAFTSGVLSDGKQTNYGFGWMPGTSKGINFAEHGGSTCGFTNHVIRIPKLKLTALILTNKFGVDNIPGYCREIVNLFANNIFEIK